MRTGRQVYVTRARVTQFAMIWGNDWLAIDPKSRNPALIEFKLVIARL